MQFSALSLSTKALASAPATQKPSLPVVAQPSGKPVSQVVAKNITPCPKFELRPFSIKVIVPANFPNPESSKDMNHLECGGYIFNYTGDNYKYHRDIKVSGPSWQKIWEIMTKDLLTYLHVDSLASLVIESNIVSVHNEYKDIGINSDSVVGMSFNGGKLEPILFTKKITPLKLRSGMNSIYLSVPSPYTSYKYINIDTVNQTITLKADPKAN